MVDFWFNHFNVFQGKNFMRVLVGHYEHHAIRPFALGRFRDLLGAVTHHPAMLYYLDNAQSVSNPPEMNNKMVVQGKKKRGLNENFARELLELHTLGVDGGYSQKDVIEVARALTGWTAVPGRGAGMRMQAQIDQAQSTGQLNNRLVQRGDFVFLPNQHDPRPKKILGRNFPGLGGPNGYQEGEQVLDMLAEHPSTAQHIAKKLVIRFVDDHPDPALINKLAQQFRRSHGDTKAMLIALVESPEFWKTRSSKVKSPLEYYASMMRALGGQVDLAQLENQGRARVLGKWFEKMGQQLYYYQAPTGFPDRAEQWINSGTLVSRINFAFALCGSQIPGLVLPQQQLQSVSKDLQSSAQYLMPGRDIEATVAQVSASSSKPEFFQSLKKNQEMAVDHEKFSSNQRNLALILSSPEFQKR